MHFVGYPDDTPEIDVSTSARESSDDGPSPRRGREFKRMPFASRSIYSKHGATTTATSTGT
jgi:hypothetical protein